MDSDDTDIFLDLIIEKIHELRDYYREHSGEIQRIADELRAQIRNHTSLVDDRVPLVALKLLEGMICDEADREAIKLIFLDIVEEREWP